MHAAKGFGSPPQEKQAPSTKREPGKKPSKTRKTSEQVLALTRSFEPAYVEREMHKLFTLVPSHRLCKILPKRLPHALL